MRARINHGDRGKSINRLIRRYEEFSCPADYYEHIESSYLNGNFDQTIELFNEMKHAQQIVFLTEYSLLSTRDFIIRNL